MGNRICAKTIMDATDSGIKFDELGISDHFYDFQNHVKPNWNYGDLDQTELKKLITKLLIVEVNVFLETNLTNKISPHIFEFKKIKKFGFH